MILILTPNISSRLQYTAEVIFRHFCGLDYELTENKEYFLNATGEKINYTPEHIHGIPWIKPSGLVFEKQVRPVTVKTAYYKGVPVLFPDDDDKTFLPFDIFSAVFYMLSRYEEYLPYEPDAYGRFPASESLAYRQGFLSVPVVDHWAGFVSAAVHNRNFNLCSTIDIDVAYAYSHKGLMRNLGGFIQSGFKGDFKGFTDRYKVLTGLRPDPYDTYDYIRDIHHDHGISPAFFVLFAEYGPNDKNLPLKNPYFHQLIRKLDRFGQVGIHPSFASFREPSKVEEEIAGLSEVLGKPVTKSRQHFLLLTLPESYRRLIKCGIQEDYSMGYADQPGFRAGTCTPFPFYDLLAEEMTGLTLFPFAFMEGTLKDYLNLEAGQAIDIVKNLIREVRKVNGTFTSLWHNESLSNMKRWQGWRAVFESIFDDSIMQSMK